MKWLKIIGVMIMSMIVGFLCAIWFSNDIPPVTISRYIDTGK